MIKEAINKVLEMAAPNLVEAHDGSYSDKKLERICVPKAAQLEFSTLDSLVEFIKAGDERANYEIIQIVAPTTVRLMSKLNFDQEREVYAEVTPIIPKFQFDHFIDLESFNIGIQAKFQDDSAGHKSVILQVAGNYNEENGVQVADDGVTQGVTIKQGVRMSNVAVPNPVTLRPIRTFIEVEQPESKFVFRMKEGGRAALFEADGKAWHIEAVCSIKNYLKEKLGDDITILA